MSLPPFFCLSLSEEPWKKESAMAHFHLHGISPCFVEGLHGMLTGLRPTNPFQYDKAGVPEYIHVAQVGCALSHVLMLKVAIASGHPEFICCEDDVQLANDFVAAWEALREKLSDDVNCIQLEYMRVQAGDKESPLVEISPGVSRCPVYAHCAGAIWWRREAAIKAVRMLRPIDAPFDIMLMWKVYPFVDHALATPPLARQRTAYGEWPSAIGSQTRRTDTERTMP